MSNEITRRVLLSTSLGIIAATVAMREASAQVSADGQRVDVLINIKWNDGKGVEGARVFDHIPNRLLGETNAAGEFFFTADLGTVIRLVEPKYGLQQSLFHVAGTPRTEKSTVPGANAMTSSFAEGWTL
ncbi:hypothetical protein E0H39_29710 [Rhizobium leguminosarum bv. viciae]|uniref:hypothetical protein n=1 Tax=Rhizobium leguminosarum TaxID=384 RepID=UPI0010391402|nr:hypothetical protein [Rhizobium leguminosarum]TBY57684.1 hypothetical protein E0H39_29710 [Rhizobium leguminosarum bv. viciae]